ncbi:MAG: hypothetical protein P8N02_17145 [Actinomycetota bacterium]|nr:hypothetical protein [Actinomycetota bacterium]
MRDSISVARQGLPAIALVTTAFWPQGDFVAMSNGMPDIPRVQIPHPVAGSGEDNMARVAADIAPQIVGLLQGS